MERKKEKEKEEKNVLGIRLMVAENFWPYLKKVGRKEVDSFPIKGEKNKLLIPKGWEDNYSWNGSGNCDYTNYYAIFERGEIKKIFSKNSWETRSGNRDEVSALVLKERLIALGKGLPDYLIQVGFSDLDNK